MSDWSVRLTMLGDDAAALLLLALGICLVLCTFLALEEVYDWHKRRRRRRGS